MCHLFQNSHIIYCATSEPSLRISVTDCYHLKVLQFLQHFSVVWICDASAGVDSATRLPPCISPTTLFVEFLSLMCVWWIFFRCILQATSDQNKCTCTFFCPPSPPFLATATPPGWVKIDSLASSTRQLRAICSHLGCSSSFCFCDCSSNIIGLKVLEMEEGGGIREGWWGDTKMRSGMKRN